MRPIIKAKASTAMRLTRRIGAREEIAVQLTEEIAKAIRQAKEIPAGPRVAKRTILEIDQIAGRVRVTRVQDIPERTTSLLTLQNMSTANTAKCRMKRLLDRTAS